MCFIEKKSAKLKLKKPYYTPLDNLHVKKEFLLLFDLNMCLNKEHTQETGHTP